MSLLYNENSKKLSLPEERIEAAKAAGSLEALEINLEQVNKLAAGIIGESNPNFTPQPNDERSKMIKSMFESGLAQLKQQKLVEALKNITLAVELAQRSRMPYEAFAIQLQEIQFMMRHKIDLSLLTGRFLDALQDIEFLMNTGMAQSDVFIRKADALLKLRQYQDAAVCCERGLSLFPNETKLKALMHEIKRNLAEFNGEN
ncbi:Sec63 complex subunit [Maudiozyma humilis]|uniref:Sec63 complex subunit n=1 Tax=Maudiozyma humilis TaxID=51915 RepID=A0AAV5RV29_MAUHU|nr:Sec63 complex subunit [Kazachstania humilis]